MLPLPDAPSKSVVDAMWVKIGGKDKPSGGTTAVKLATAPNTDGSVQVGVFEEMAGGVGPQWRAGVWISAFVATADAGSRTSPTTRSPRRAAATSTARRRRG